MFYSPVGQKLSPLPARSGIHYASSVAFYGRLGSPKTFGCTPHLFKNPHPFIIVMLHKFHFNPDYYLRQVPPHHSRKFLAANHPLHYTSEFVLLCDTVSQITIRHQPANHVHILPDLAAG